MLTIFSEGRSPPSGRSRLSSKSSAVFLGAASLSTADDDDDENLGPDRLERIEEQVVS